MKNMVWMVLLFFVGYYLLYNAFLYHEYLYPPMSLQGALVIFAAVTGLWFIHEAMHMLRGDHD